MQGQFTLESGARIPSKEIEYSLQTLTQERRIFKELCTNFEVVFLVISIVIATTV